MELKEMHEMRINDMEQQQSLYSMYDSKHIPTLYFGRGNAKLSKRTIHFGLPTGYTCTKYAKECLTFSDRSTGKITDSKTCEFRCWSASQEAYSPQLRAQRWNNYEALKGLSYDDMVYVISWNLMNETSEYYNDHEQMPIVRINVSGEFFSNEYFLAWTEVANKLKDYVEFFYAYTKAIPLWIKYQDLVPTNLKLRASYGGKFDHLIEEHNLPYAKVLFDETTELEIDHDDTKSRDPDNYHAVGLLLHGTQPKQSDASKAVQKLKSKGFSGYGSNRKQGDKR